MYDVWYRLLPFGIAADKEESNRKPKWGIITPVCIAKTLNDRFTKDWSYMRSYMIKDGHLLLSLMVDGGTYEFEPLGKP